jgi:hypothetical protein
MIKETSPATRLIAARVLTFDPRRGTATVVTADGKRVLLGWEHVKHVASLIDVDTLVMLVTSEHGEMLRIRLASTAEATR